MMRVGGALQSRPQEVSVFTRELPCSSAVVGTGVRQPLLCESDVWRLRLTQYSLIAVKERECIFMTERLGNCIETEGKTVQEAVDNALLRLGVEKDDVDIEILDEGSRGVFSIIGSRHARVRVRLKSIPQPSVEPAQLVESLLSAMGFSATVRCTHGDDVTEVDIGPTDADGLLIGKRGETLECLQHIVSKMFNRDTSHWRHVVVDIGGYRKRREGQLSKLAKSLAERVSATGEEVTTDPLKASERRIIHLALKDHPTVRSFAVGEGPVKRVVIGLKETGRT